MDLGVDKGERIRLFLNFTNGQKPVRRRCIHHFLHIFRRADLLRTPLAMVRTHEEGEAWRRREKTHLKEEKSWDQVYAQKMWGGENSLHGFPYQWEHEE